MFDEQFAERRSVELVLAVCATCVLVLALAGIATSLSRTIADAEASIGIHFTVGATAPEVTGLQLRSVVVDLAVAAALICAIHAIAYTTGAPTVMLQLWLTPAALVLLFVFCAVTTHAAVCAVAKRPLSVAVAS